MGADAAMTQDKAMVHCPVDGCDFGPKPRKSVVAHYSGTRDRDHKGGYSKAQGVVPEPDATASEPGSEPEQGEAGDVASGAREGQQNQSSEAQQQGSDPAKSTPPVDDTVSKSGGEPECPECGGNRWFDASEYTSGQYSHGCADCSDKSNWVVWNE